MIPTHSHINDLLSSLTDRRERERFMKALITLGPHVVHKREVSNGKDFLFGDTSEPLHDALKDLISLEHHVSHRVQFDYARLENFFLLRITGKTDTQPLIDTFFDPTSSP